MARQGENTEISFAKKVWDGKFVRKEKRKVWKESVEGKHFERTEFGTGGRKVICKVGSVEGRKKENEKERRKEREGIMGGRHLER